MGSLITESVSAFAAMVTVVIAYTIFSPVINDTLQSLVLNELASPTGMLAINANAFLLTNNIIIIGTKTFVWFMVFLICFRMFAYIGWRTEEQGVY